MIEQAQGIAGVLGSDQVYFPKRIEDPLCDIAAADDYGRPGFYAPFR